MPDVTFRDFAGALMENDDAKASTVLQTLLGADADQAASATAYFRKQMAASPDFMMKAMGMRTVVEGRDEAGLKRLIAECFGFDEDGASQAAKAVLAHYA